jgi:hypothetical protein
MGACSILAACVLALALLQSWFPQAALTWNAVSWSLWIEAFFYLVFPILLLVEQGIHVAETILGGSPLVARESRVFHALNPRASRRHRQDQLRRNDTA